MVQDCIDRWHLEFKLTDKEKVIEKGEKYGGWAALRGSSGSCAVSIRDAWQNYPNEMELSKNNIKVHLWPRHGRILDFRTKAILEIYGDDAFKAVDNFFLRQKGVYKKSLND
ncbi:MAG: exo-rhamnogalacturonan lyase family protein, partial [Planctomycetota bacterium]